MGFVYAMEGILGMIVRLETYASKMIVTVSELVLMINVNVVQDILVIIVRLLINAIMFIVIKVHV